MECKNCEYNFWDCLLLSNPDPQNFICNENCGLDFEDSANCRYKSLAICGKMICLRN